MKNWTFTICIFVAVWIAGSSLRSQGQAPAPATLPAASAADSAAAKAAAAEQSQTVATLQALKAGNEKILAQQKATLDQIAKLTEDARQIKIWSKRG